jgi:hypothetical protein
MTSRSVKRVHPAYRDDIADLRTVRPLPGPEIDRIDPFPVPEPSRSVDTREEIHQAMRDARDGKFGGL